MVVNCLCFVQEDKTRHITHPRACHESREKPKLDDDEFNSPTSQQLSNVSPAPRLSSFVSRQEMCP
jgi:hypothetical protein